MNSLARKAGYIKGLMEGLTFSEPGHEKIMNQIVDLLGDLCDRVDAVEDLIDELNDYVESIDDDLTELESDRDGGFSLLDDEDFDEDYMEDENDSSHRLHLIGGGKPANVDEADSEDADDDEDDEEPIIGAVVCPECTKPFFISLEDPEGAIYACPHCGKRVLPEPLSKDDSLIAHPIDE